MEATPVERRQKLVLGTVMVLILAFALILVQSQFDKGDDRRARELLASRAPNSQWWVGRELVERADGGAPSCESQMVSSCQGILQLTCNAGEPPPYVFSVDLVRSTVTPADPRTKELMEAITAKDAALRADAGTP
ncbi:MAG: hypothetical protein ACT4TC_14670 [Myxococcaceae bacterium]